MTYWFPPVSWYVGRWWCDIFEWCTTRSELESITQRHTEWWLPPQWQCRELSEHTTTKSKSWEYWKQMYQYQNRFWFLLYLYFLMNINTNLFLVWITFAMINWFLFDTEFWILVYIWVITCTAKLLPLGHKLLLMHEVLPVCNQRMWLAGYHPCVLCLWKSGLILFLNISIHNQELCK